MRNIKMNTILNQLFVYSLAYLSLGIVVGVPVALIVFYVLG